MDQRDLDRFDELSKLEPGWASYNALPPNSKSIHLAKLAFEQIQNKFNMNGIKIGIFPLLDGGISLELDNQKCKTTFCEFAISNSLIHDWYLVTVYKEDFEFSCALEECVNPSMIKENIDFLATLWNSQKSFSDTTS